MALGWLVILVGATLHQEDHAFFTRNTIESKDVTYLRELGKEKVFEVSVIELSNNSTILACIYRSPDSDYYTVFSRSTVFQGSGENDR
jgi:hypothetical protein